MSSILLLSASCFTYVFPVPVLLLPCPILFVTGPLIFKISCAVLLSLTASVLISFYSFFPLFLLFLFLFWSRTHNATTWTSVSFLGLFLTLCFSYSYPCCTPHSTCRCIQYGGYGGFMEVVTSFFTLFFLSLVQSFQNGMVILSFFFTLATCLAWLSVCHSHTCASFVLIS